MIDGIELETLRQEFAKKYPNGKCNTINCEEHCYIHPEKGRLLFCKECFERISKSFSHLNDIDDIILFNEKNS